MLQNGKTFELDDLFLDSPGLHENIFPQTRKQGQDATRDPIYELIEKDPFEVLGFKNISEPRKISEDTIGTPLQEFYRGLNVFVTGGTGFLGKLLIEKLIRSIPHIGKIFILIRSKKGMSSKERLQQLLEDKVFLRMKTEVPHYQSKLAYIDGDISEPELGLSEADRQTLQSQVHVVFHSAADVRFINSLRNSINCNVLGSKRMIDLAKGMRNLKSFVYVSTAYSNCVRRVIEEKFYKLKFNYKDILKIMEEKSDEEIEREKSSILQGWPNTYTFSKALSEDMISEEAQQLPICIFRPSVVWPTYKEPFRGWTDNIYGASGLIMAIGLGVLHTFPMEESLTLDIVPADFTVNAMVAVGWENAINRPNDSIPVFNYTSAPRIIIIWKNVYKIGFKWMDIYPFEQAIYYGSFFPASSDAMYEIGHFLLHKIPGMIFDKIAVATGRQPRLTKVYNTLHTNKEVLNYFMYGTWEFKGEKMSNLWNKLTEEDRKLFHFDVSIVRFEEYFLIGRLGIKYFYLKEKLENMPAAYRKWKWLKLLHQSLLAVSGLAALKLMVTVARVLPI